MDAAPCGEAREIFRYRGGIEALHATSNNLYLVLSVLPEAFEGEPNTIDGLAASVAASKQREESKTTAVLHKRFPTRYWDADLGPGQSRLFVAPLPELDAPADLTWPQGDGDKMDEAKPWTPGELQLAAVALPAAPAGASQWDLVSALPAPGGAWAVVTMRRRDGIDSATELWVCAPDEKPRLLVSYGRADADVAAISDDGAWALTTRNLPPLPGQTIRETTFRTDIASGAQTQIWEDHWNDAALSASGEVFVTADRRGRGGIYRLHDRSATLVTPDDECAYSNLTWAGGWLVALRSSIAQSPEIVFVDPLTGEVSLGPRLTADFETPGALTEIEATAADGTALRAWLVLPHGEGPHPLVVFAHGGPWGSWNDWTWRWNPWVFAQRGYAVLLPDPGISTGYGQQMISRGHDSIGDQPFTDIMALTDAAIARPDIDADRQLFAGGSYGGYMANWVAGHTGDRFKGIVTHASLWNVESMARTTDNGSWYQWMMSPTGDSTQAQQWSPHLFADRIEVPMLVVHGDRDYRVPVSQGLELWLDLQRLSPELDHQYLYFPDEGHWVLKPGNAQAWYETFLGFLDARLEDGAESAQG